MKNSRRLSEHPALFESSIGIQVLGCIGLCRAHIPHTVIRLRPRQTVRVDCARCHTHQRLACRSVERHPLSNDPRTKDTKVTLPWRLN